MLGNMFIILGLVFEASITSVTEVTDLWFFLLFLLKQKLALLKTKKSLYSVCYHESVRIVSLFTEGRKKEKKEKILHFFPTGFGHGHGFHSDSHDDGNL